MIHENRYKLYEPRYEKTFSQQRESAFSGTETFF